MRTLPASHPDEDEDTDVNSYLSAQGRPGGREVGVGAGAEGLCVCVWWEGGGGVSCTCLTTADRNDR